MPYFRSWKRKLGVVALLMACVFMAGWVRGLFIVDSFTLPAMTHRSTTTFSISVSEFHSCPQYVCWYRTYEECPIEEADADIDPELKYPKWETSAKRPQLDGLGLNWTFAGFTVCDATEDGARISAVFVPYWSIVLPLALLSAWLLLSKPRAGMTSGPTQS